MKKLNSKAIKKETIKNTRRQITEEKLRQAASLNANELYERLDTTSEGLNTKVAEDRLDKLGLNEITSNENNTWYKKAYEAFINPFNVILIMLALISFITDYILPPVGDKSLKAVIIITVMVGLSGILKLVQEGKSNTAGKKLKEMITTTATVIRDKDEVETPINELVVGDIIKLSAGDMIPADVRVLFSKDLFISQASMTGESEPVEKFSKELSQLEVLSKSALEFDNIAFMGTNVISGSAIAVVVVTGDDTFIGNIANIVTEKREETSFDKGVNSVSMVLVKFMAIMAPSVFLINGLTKGDWLEAFLFGISIAVGLTPEMLPMIVTTNLAKGAVAMSKRKAVVKNLNSIQNFGAIDVLCTDKTGTLTEDKIILERHLDVEGNENLSVLKHGYLISYFQTGLKNLLDIAILDYGKSMNLDEIVINYKKIDEVPFDFSRRKMSVVISDNNNNNHLLTKGAVEEMLDISSQVEYKGEIVKLSDKLKKEVQKTVDDLNARGMRVIGVSRKEIHSNHKGFSVDDENDMILVGYIAFLDPPKKSALDAIKGLKEYGVDIKVLTGDNEKVTKHVCMQVGINVGNIVLGHEVEVMSDDKLREVVEITNVFAKLSPSQKSRVVSMLRKNGHVVGFMGDGINDAPAMRKSDVGISVDTGVDIAKESADIILLEKDLTVLEKGLIEGRKTYANIIKYIKMTASSNFGNMFSVLVASVFLPFLPMLPVQILILNLIYDISCISIPWDNVDSEYLKKPRAWDASSIGNFMKWIGPTSSVFDIVTYLLMYFIICPSVLGGGYNDLGVDKTLFMMLFNAGWFVESLWSQTLVIHMIRTPKLPFIQSRASLPLMILTTIGIAVGTIIPYTPLGDILGMHHMPLVYFLWLALIIVLYMVLVTIVKKIYIKKYKELL